MLTGLRCVICEGSLHELERPLFTGRPLMGERIAVCGNCGSAQVVPMPAPATLAQLYTGDYYMEFASGRGMAGGANEIRPYLRGRLTELARRCGRGRLLDLGCGIGIFVAYA